jgi:hypothetical protein
MAHSLQDLLGESSRGMQDADLVGLVSRAAPGIHPAHAKAVARLLARGVTKQSSQIGFIAVATITGTGNTNPIPAAGSAISAVTRVQRPFKPCKFFVQEFVSAVDSASTPNTASGSNATAIDLFLSGSFMGGDNTFPNAPTNTIANGGTAVNCAIFNANNLGSGISWAEVPGGIDMTLNFIAAPSLIGSLIKPPAAGFTGTVTYTITVSAQLMGPMAPT